jgi:hypothetical protein
VHGGTVADCRWWYGRQAVHGGVLAIALGTPSSRSYERRWEVQLHAQNLTKKFCDE